MHLSDHDLRQFDDAYLETLTPPQARALLGKALADLKAARERLGQNPSNSSRPPSTRLPWEGSGGDDTPAGEPDVPAESGDVADAADTPGGDARGVGIAKAAPPGHAPHAHRPPPVGARGPGHRRTQHLPVDAEQSHRPTCCAGCGQALTAAQASRAHNARYEIELIQPGAGAYRTAPAPDQAHLF